MNGGASRRVALVTGATGFIGRRLAERLVEDGWAVRVLVRNRAGLAPELRHAVEVVVGDLGDEQALLEAVRGVTVVFHCAANVSTWDAARAYYAANVLGARNLVNAIKKAEGGQTRLIHVSTLDVYGFPSEPCDEASSSKPSGFGYGDSKRVGEGVVRDLCGESGIPYVIVRPGNVIGPGSQFITRIGAELASGLMLVVDKGRANAGLVYVDNLVDYMLWAARSEKAIGQCYNVRDSYDVTWAEFVARFRGAIKGRGVVLNLPFWAADAAARLLEAIWRAFMPAREPLLHRLLVRIFGRTCGHSAEKIRRDSTLTGKIGFDEAMERSVRWFLDERNAEKKAPPLVS